MPKKVLGSIFLSLAVAAALLLPVQLARADGPRVQRGNILITENAHFDKQHGVVSGSGTAADPYVISGWIVNSMRISDTSAHVVIYDNQASQMALNWIGPGVHVMNNDVGDLRVNQNVKRTGEMTSGHFAHNTFDVVGQLRHFDGVFEHNVVGAPESGMEIPFFSNERAVNFDGFNGSRFRNNTIYGYVDVRLHGHHHGSGYGEESHYHGAAHDHEAMDHEKMDHSDRWHQVFVSNNKIYSDYYWALRYFDQAHSANDRTAASETNEELNKPHVHHTRVNMTGNRLFGSGIAVDIFNADDQRHTGTAPGVVNISNNRISLAAPVATDLWSERDGIAVNTAKDVTVNIIDNVVNGPEPQEGPLAPPYEQGTTGIRLYNLDEGYVHIVGNKITNRYYGVFASQFTPTVWWWVTDLEASGTSQDVYYDQSVPNKPNSSPRGRR